MSELLTNGTFASWSSETDADGWTEGTAGASTVTRYATNPVAGSYCCRLTIDGSDNSASIAQSPTLAIRQHRLLFRHRESGSATCGYTIVDDTTGHYLQADGTWGADVCNFRPSHQDNWMERSHYFTTVSAGAHTITLKEGSSVTSQTIDFDTASLKPSETPTTDLQNYYTRQCHRRRAMARR